MSTNDPLRPTVVFVSRGEAANNEVSAIEKAGARVKGKELQKGYQKTKLLPDGTARASKPGRGKKPGKGTGKRRGVAAKGVPYGNVPM